MGSGCVADGSDDVGGDGAGEGGVEPGEVRGDVVCRAIGVGPGGGESGFGEESTTLEGPLGDRGEGAFGLELVLVGAGAEDGDEAADALGLGEGALVEGGGGGVGVDEGDEGVESMDALLL